MAVRPRNSEKTKARILRAARRLFAERDIASVGIRDIASAAGFSHGLVQRYFGTREQMIAEIVRQEVERFTAAPAPSPNGGSTDELTVVREQLNEGYSRFQDYARFIMRAELAGIAPETMLSSDLPTPAMLLADVIRRLQEQARGEHPPLDPALVSAYANASLFAFGAMAPWLMASVGLDPEDYEARQGEIVDITVRLIALAAGVENKETVPGRSQRRRPSERIR